MQHIRSAEGIQQPVVSYQPSKADRIFQAKAVITVTDSLSSVSNCYFLVCFIAVVAAKQQGLAISVQQEVQTASALHALAWK